MQGEKKNNNNIYNIYKKREENLSSRSQSHLIGCVLNQKEMERDTHGDKL